MQKVIKLLEQELWANSIEEVKALSEDQIEYNRQLKLAIKTLKGIGEKPSIPECESSLPMINTVAISVDPCDRSCTICKGKGFVIVDQPTTGIKSKHKCSGKTIAGSPFEIIYPEYWPKDLRHQPEVPKVNVTIIDGNNVTRI